MTNLTSRRALTAALLLTPALLLAAGGETRMRTSLTGGAIAGLTPSGKAEYRASAGRARLNVEVEDVNLPAGTVASVRVNGAEVGKITISAAPVRGGELELNTQDGQSVPVIASGALVVVRAGESAIVSGVLK